MRPCHLRLPSTAESRISVSSFACDVVNRWISCTRRAGRQRVAAVRLVDPRKLCTTLARGGAFISAWQGHLAIGMLGSPIAFGIESVR